MGDGRGDFQRVWHEFAGTYFDGKSILDVGGGYGYSRPRLEHGGRNRVALQDIDRSLMNVCDVILDVSEIQGSWDVVTAFDVIEHVVHPQRFLESLFVLAKEGVFFTTPSKFRYTQPWHFYPLELLGMVTTTGIPVSLTCFARYREADLDEVREVSEAQFLSDKTIYAHGLYAKKAG